MHSLVKNMLVFELERVFLCVITDCKLNCLALENISYSPKSTSFFIYLFHLFFLFIRTQLTTLTIFTQLSSLYLQVFIAFYQN